ncbi:MULTISPECIES: hypothetical protein [Cryobacterium]|uniref:hypothetical protein n=1 Tax=Cryobacterium TaxID=69578 RepID=UPI00141ABB01|nr:MULTISPECIES: hypothetical protein [Cryobacterium]
MKGPPQQVFTRLDEAQIVEVGEASERIVGMTFGRRNIPHCTIPGRLPLVLPQRP